MLGVCVCTGMGGECVALRMRRASHHMCPTVGIIHVIYRISFAGAMAELRSEEKSSPENEGMKLLNCAYAHAGAGYHCLTSQTVNSCTWRSAA